MEQAELGIDVSKALLDVLLLMAEGQRRAGSSRNTLAGFKQLVHWLKKALEGSGPRLSGSDGLVRR